MKSQDLDSRVTHMFPAVRSTPAPPASPARSPVHHYLRAATAGSHAALEERLVTVLDAIPMQSYIGLLQSFHGFYAPVERAIVTEGSGSDLGIDLKVRLKTPLIQNDLRALGMLPGDVAGLPECAAIPCLRTIGEVLGCLYVLEGATLGGKLIARHVSRRLDVARVRGCAFFHSYGPAVGTMWSAFLTALETRAGSPDVVDQMADSARDTFRCMEAWLIVE